MPARPEQFKSDRVPGALYVLAGIALVLTAAVLVSLSYGAGEYGPALIFTPPLILSAALLFHAGGVKGS